MGNTGTCDEMKDVMVDIETLDTAPGAAILQIGAVRFDSKTGAYVEETFLMNASLDSNLDAGLTVNGDTFAWWMKQSDAARASLFSPEPWNLRDVLEGFNGFLRKDDRVWCHGSFDLPCICSAMRRVRVKPAWSYKLTRDLRTFFDDHGYDPYSMKADESLVKHTAVGDCLWQIRQVKAALDKKATS